MRALLHEALRASKPALRCSAVSHWIARALQEISEFKVIPATS